MIESVERFQPEIQLELLTNREVPAQLSVQLYVLGTTYRISADIPKGPACILRKRGSIEKIPIARIGLGERLVGVDVVGVDQVGAVIAGCRQRVVSATPEVTVNGEPS